MSNSISRTTLLAILLLGVQTGIGKADTLSATLVGYNAVPTLFTAGSGLFTGTTTATSINYTLTYKNLAGAVQQAHIHIGKPGIQGAINAFICTNLGNGPLGTPPCPAPPATISGTITAANIINLAVTQGIGSGQIARVLKAIPAGAIYVDVHSTFAPGGEIRGQIVSTP